MKQFLKRPFTLVVLTVLFATLILTACGRGGSPTPAPQEESQAGKEPDTLYLALSDDPPSLNPLTAKDEVSFNILNALMEGLVRQTPDGVYPKGSGLAEDWRLSADGRTYTFTLKDAKWSNGDPLTAEDFEYSWKWILDPRNGAQYAFQLYLIEGAREANQISLPEKPQEPQEPNRDDYESEEDYEAALEGFEESRATYPEETASYEEALAEVEPRIEAALDRVAVQALDEETLEVRLVQPSPFFLSLLAFPTYFPVHPSFYESVGTSVELGGEYGSDIDSVVSIGPFRIKEWIRDGEMVLEKNKTYWDADAVKLEGIHFDIVKDSNTGVNLYEAGDLDRVRISDRFLEKYQDKPETSWFADGSIWFLVFNQEYRDLWTNSKIRRAFSLAIDREILANEVMRTHLPARSFTSSIIYDAEGNRFQEAWLEGENLYPPKAQPEEAQQLLAEGLEELDLESFPEGVKILTDDLDVARRRDQAVQEMLRQNLGIQVELDPVDLQTKLTRMASGDFDIVFNGWGPDYDDPMTFLDLWVSDGPFNDASWENERYDALIEEASRLQDNTQRMEAFAEAERLLAGEMPIATLTEGLRYLVTRPSVTGIHERAIGARYEWKWASVQREE